MDFDLKWHEPEQAIIDRRVLRHGATALFMASEWRKLCNPFVPMDTGVLANHAVALSSRGNVGYIHYQTPYARWVYRGTSFSFSHEKHPLAGAEWDKAAVRAGKYKDLKRSTQAYVDRKKT